MQITLEKLNHVEGCIVLQVYMQLDLHVNLSSVDQKMGDTSRFQVVFSLDITFLINLHCDKGVE